MPYKNKEKQKEFGKRKAQTKKYKDTAYKSYLKRVYKITFEEYNMLLDKQKGVCANCNMPETQCNKKTGKVNKLSVDHCHKTGKVRFLLCHKCNSGLGYFNEDPKLLKNMARLIENIKK
jgi:hypothetical protein